MSLAERILKGDVKSAARLISLIEEGETEGYGELQLLMPHTGGAHVIGITGPAGSGKSTAAGRIAVRFASQRRKVGIIAIDPTSMRGRGALLGDRVRMKEAEKMDDIFIRSMAHRGYPGGVARAATGATHVLEGLGKDLVIIESVGAGQSDTALFFLADTVITLITPDYGDEIQLMKAGLFEIGDIIVINKSDRLGAEDAWQELSHRFGKTARNGWFVPVLLTRADMDMGMDALVDAVNAHWKYLRESGLWKTQKQQKARSFAELLLREELWKRFLEKRGKSSRFRQTMALVENGKKDPYTAVDELLENATSVDGGKGRERQARNNDKGEEKGKGTGTGKNKREHGLKK
jgi:LAO/AO transport system kinase